MRLSEQLSIVGEWLDNTENETLMQAEEGSSEVCLDVVARALVQAGTILKQAAEEIAAIEPSLETVITPEKLDEMAALATEFESSGDEMLIRQANLLDDILLTLGDSSGALMQAKKAESDRIEILKKRYRETYESQKEVDGIKEAEKAIAKAPIMKEYHRDHTLSARHCIEHPGVSLMKEGENWKCPLDGKSFNWEEGFKLENGNKVPPGSVQGQSQLGQDQSFTPFNSEDSRTGRMGQK